MPTYEFRCGCGTVWEEMQSIKLDSHKSVCPNCQEVCDCIITGGGGFAFVSHRDWNPVKGFPGNDAQKNREARKTELELDKVVKRPANASDAQIARAKKKIAGTGGK